MANPAPRIDFPDDSGISDRQYRLWKEMLENRTGVRIAPDRDRFARGQIARRMAELDVRDPDTYFREVLETLSGNAEWGLLLDRLLNKETRFFRHRDSFEYLEQRISERLARHRTGFIESNILESVSPPFADAMDIIFCHNVLIYFRRWRRRQVVSRLVASLKVGGLLLVGPGELSDWVPPGLERDRYPGVQAYVRIE